MIGTAAVDLGQCACAELFVFPADAIAEPEEAVVVFSRLLNDR